MIATQTPAAIFGKAPDRVGAWISLRRDAKKMPRVVMAANRMAGMRRQWRMVRHWFSSCHGV